MILPGDTLTVLRTLPDASVHCVVTSPPYWGLRDYGVDGQLGLEQLHDCLGWATGSPCGECHVCRMVDVFREVRRVLRKDGTLWLNYGDSYAVKQSGNGDLAGTKQGTNRGCYGQARRTQGIELNPEYVDMARARIHAGAGLLGVG